MTIHLHEYGNEVFLLPYLLDRTISILQMERKNGLMRGGKIFQNYIILEKPDKLAVVGDLHGDIQTLNQIMTRINNENFLDNPRNKLVFLGDYVDRGSGSIEVLCNLCELKIRHPDSVILMRGNHEAVSEFPFPSHDLPTKIEEVFGTSKEFIHKKILDLFQLLASIVIVERKIFFVHGGLPVDNPDNFDNIDTILENISNQKLEDLLWNDPRDIETWEISRRKFGKHFGKSVTRKWLDLTNTCVLVRGHEPCHGFKIDHDDMILTIFSCKESYPAFDAAYLLIKNNQLDEIKNASSLARYIKKVKGTANNQVM